MSRDEFFKVVLIGGTNVGKSTIYVHDTFTPATIPTIGEFNSVWIAIELSSYKLVD